MRYLTDFADQAVVLPVAGAVLLGLLAVGWRRGALAWALSVGGVLLTMLGLKLVVFACFIHWDLAGHGRFALSSPSGHTAASAVVYGGLLALLAPRSVAGTLLAAFAGGLVALLFGMTRLALQVHTVTDVLAGAAVGVLGAVAMRAMAGERPRDLSPPRLVLLACVVMIAFHGNRLEAESHIRLWAVDVWPLNLCR